jgi:mannan endo-1,4-beta-mannosidase
MRRHGKTWILVSLVVMTMTTTCSCETSGTAATVDSPSYCAVEARTVPRYLGVTAPGEPHSMGGVTDFANLIGKNPDLISYYISFGENFNAAFTCDIAKRGALALIQIDPTRTPVANIAAGYYDDYLDKYAEAVKSFGSPVAISFGHEMNAPWYRWGWKHTRPSVFVAAWRQIHDVFAAVGATNVIWAWTININSPGTRPISEFYPGNAYVDWVGLDGYFRLRGTTFGGLFGSTMRQVEKLCDKPMLVTETGVGAGIKDSGSEVSTLFAAVEQQKNILGFVWFNYHGQMDWRLQNNAAALAVFRRDDRRGW